MDSIQLLAARVVNQLGQPGTEVKEALQKLMQAVADMNRRHEGAPEPVATAAVAVSGKSCRYGCPEEHKLQECPRFLQLSPKNRKNNKLTLYKKYINDRTLTNETAYKTAKNEYNTMLRQSKKNILRKSPR